jgi:hypothetical protein
MFYKRKKRKKKDEFKGRGRKRERERERESVCVCEAEEKSVDGFSHGHDLVDVFGVINSFFLFVGCLSFFFTS